MLANLPLANTVLAQKENGRLPLILKISASLTTAGLLIWFYEPVVDILRIVSDREAVAAYLDQFGVLAPLLLGIILVLQVIVAAIPGHALMVGGGYVFGFVPAFCISLVMTVLGSQIGFMLARWAGRPLVEKLAPVELLAKVGEGQQHEGSLLFVQLAPDWPGTILHVEDIAIVSVQRPHVISANRVEASKPHLFCRE